MSFNWNEEGIPVAMKFISDRSKNNKILYLDESQTAYLDPEDITKDHLEIIYGKDAIRRKVGEKRMKQQLIKDIKGHGILKDEVRIKEGNAKFKALPDIDMERMVWFLSGQSGSGKSYFSAELINTYKKLGVKNIYIITSVPDEKFGKAIYIDIDKLVVSSQNKTYAEKMKDYKEAKLRYKYKKAQLIEEGANIDDIIALELEIDEMKPIKDKKVDSFEIADKKFNEKYGNSLWLFDDYENINAQKLKKITFLRDHLLTTGRHIHANMIICNHLTNFVGARLILAETHAFVLFNKGTRRSKDYFLNNYVGMDKQQIKRVHKELQKSRWVCIIPQKKYALYQKLIYLYE